MRTTNTMAAAFFLMLLLPSGCSLMAPYNQYSYERATSLKVEAMMLVEKAEEPYSSHEEEIEVFKVKMLKAHEYVSGIPKNTETASQWAVLIDAEGKSIFGFLEFWKKQGNVSATFAEEYGKEIEKHFNTIIELEAAKIRSR